MPTPLDNLLYRVSQFLIIGLVSVVLYFVKETNDEIKYTHRMVDAHETKIQLQQAELNYLTGRVEVISKYSRK